MNISIIHIIKIIINVMKINIIILIFYHYCLCNFNLMETFKKYIICKRIIVIVKNYFKKNYKIHSNLLNWKIMKLKQNLINVKSRHLICIILPSNKNNIK